MYLLSSCHMVTQAVPEVRHQNNYSEVLKVRDVLHSCVLWLLTRHLYWWAKSVQSLPLGMMMNSLKTVSWINHDQNSITNWSWVNPFETKYILRCFSTFKTQLSEGFRQFASVELVWFAAVSFLFLGQGWLASLNHHLVLDFCQTLAIAICKYLQSADFQIQVFQMSNVGTLCTRASILNLKLGSSWHIGLVQSILGRSVLCFSQSAGERWNWTGFDRLGTLRHLFA